MASNVVNLNRFRKKKQREEKVKQAEINRIRHGRTQAMKDHERLERDRAARAIDAKRLERDTAEPTASEAHEPTSSSAVASEPTPGNATTLKRDD